MKLKDTILFFSYINLNFKSLNNQYLTFILSYFKDIITLSDDIAVNVGCLEMIIFKEFGIKIFILISTLPKILSM